MRSRPDVLVLGSGGVLGEAWMMGVLAGIEDAAGLDLRDCESFVGTSAGSVVAAHLVAGRSPRRPSSIGIELELGHSRPSRSLTHAGIVAIRRMGRTAATAGSLFAPLALGAAAPGGALVRSMLLRTLPRAADTLASLHAGVAASGARFDGRLRVVAVERASGRRVVFGRPGAPPATVADAVMASCTVPWLFTPVTIAGREYVDGGVWSPTNLDVAPAGRDTHVLCLNPTASLGDTHPLLALLRGVARTAASVEALALHRRGAHVRTIAPDGESSTAMGLDYMDAAPRIRVLACGYRQGLRLAERA